MHWISVRFYEMGDRKMIFLVVCSYHSSFTSQEGVVFLNRPKKGAQKDDVYIVSVQKIGQNLFEED